MGRGEEERRNEEERGGRRGGGEERGEDRGKGRERKEVGERRDRREEDDNQPFMLTDPWTHFFSSSSSQTHASRSRWLVGSSRSRRVGRTNSALAREIRILHPPEKSLHFISCISAVNPIPGGLITRQKVSTNLTLSLCAITPNCSV